MRQGHRTRPTLDYELQLWAEGYNRVAGLDEAGRGAWAGPVVAAAVMLPREPKILPALAQICDSKQLTAAQRAAGFEAVKRHALAWGVGAVPPAEIDAQGIVPATRQAMALALQAITPPADYLLIDYLCLSELALPQHSLPKGDVQILSIAAASIVAKVSRDLIMNALDARFPGYGFERHKGYGTVQHRTALLTLGPSEAHRHTFAPLCELQRWGAGG